MLFLEKPHFFAKRKGFSRKSFPRRQGDHEQLFRRDVFLFISRVSEIININFCKKVRIH